MQWIEPTVTGDLVQGYKGGLEDIGNFKEGFCFRLKSSTNVVWNVCADTMVKYKINENLIKLIIKKKN